MRGPPDKRKRRPGEDGVRDHFPGDRVIPYPNRPRGATCVLRGPAEVVPLETRRMRENRRRLSEPDPHRAFMSAQLAHLLGGDAPWPGDAA